MADAKHTPGHKLNVNFPLDGLPRGVWTCECGQWRPSVKGTRFEMGRYPRDTVLAFIHSEHAKHASAAIAKATGDAS